MVAGEAEVEARAAAYSGAEGALGQVVALSLLSISVCAGCVYVGGGRVEKAGI